MAFVEKFDQFFDLKGHADAAVYTQQVTATTVALNGIFEANYIAPLSLVQTEESSFICELSKIPAVKSGDMLFCRAYTYTIRVVERDWEGGEGLVMLHLKK